MNWCKMKYTNSIFKLYIKIKNIFIYKSKPKQYRLNMTTFEQELCERDSEMR